MYKKVILCCVILLSLTNGKKIFKALKNKDFIKNAAVMGTGVVLSDLSWGQISDEFSYLEQRVGTLEEIYHEKISPTMDKIHVIQNSVYPIFSIFIIGAIIGLVLISKRIQKDDLSQFLARISRIPEYLNRIRASNIFANNHAPPSAPYLQNHDIIPHRQNPYFNNAFPMQQMANNPILPAPASQNNVTLESGTHGNT